VFDRAGSSARILFRPAVLALVCVAAFAGSASGSALVGAQAPRTIPGCNSHRSFAVKMTSQVLVWRKHTGTDPDSGGRLTTLYACRRPAGSSVAIGQRAADGGEYIGNVATSDLSITGTQVSDLSASGLASQEACYKYDPTNPQCATAASQVAQVFNLVTRRSLHQPLAGAAVAYAFAPTGAIAWEAPTSPGTMGSPLMLQAVGFDPSTLKEGPIETLDTGDLAGPLQFTGLTLEWMNAGQPKSAVLTNTS
jgi:hypothetical protein